MCRAGSRLSQSPSTRRKRPNRRVKNIRNPSSEESPSVSSECNLASNGKSALLQPPARELTRLARRGSACLCTRGAFAAVCKNRTAACYESTRTGSQPGEERGSPTKLKRAIWRPRPPLCRSSAPPWANHAATARLYRPRALTAMGLSKADVIGISPRSAASGQRTRFSIKLESGVSDSSLRRSHVASC